MLGALAMIGWFVFHGVRPESARQVPRPAARVRPLVVVDPGHGGIDPGSRAGGMTEARVNLAVSRALARVLTRMGYQVLLTRSDHGCRPGLVVVPWTRRARAAGCRINLRDRVFLAIHRHASAFLSIHSDLYGDPSVWGPRTYYVEESQVQAALAADIQHELDRFRKRPVAPITCRHFTLLALRTMPAVTIEVGYLSNPAERRRLEDPNHQMALAEAIARGFGHFAQTHALLPPPTVDPREIDREWQSKRGRLYRPYEAPGIGRVPAQGHGPRP